MAGKPKPTAIKLLEGNPGKRPLNDSEPQPKRHAPECPEWLDSVARGIWEDLAPRLERLGLLTEIDGPMFAAFCQSCAIWQFNARLVAKNKTEFVQNHDKKINKTKSKPSPRSVAIDFLNQTKGLAALFGLSPSDRSKLHISKSGDNAIDDILDDF